MSSLGQQQQQQDWETSSQGSAADAAEQYGLPPGRWVTVIRSCNDLWYTRQAEPPYCRTSSTGSHTRVLHCSLYCL